MNSYQNTPCFWI